MTINRRIMLDLNVIECAAANIQQPPCSSVAYVLFQLQLPQFCGCCTSQHLSGAPMPAHVTQHLQPHMPALYIHLAMYVCIYLCVSACMFDVCLHTHVSTRVMGVLCNAGTVCALHVECCFMAPLAPARPLWPAQQLLRREQCCLSSMAPR